MDKFEKIINSLLARLLVGIMAVLVVNVLWQVASRYLLGSPSKFTDELAGFLLIWLGVLGAAYVTGQKQHLAIDLLVSKLPVNTQKRVNVLIDSLVFTFGLLVFVIGGSWLVITRFQLEVHSVALRLPLGVVYSVLPLSGLLICFYSIVSIKNNLNQN